MEFDITLQKTLAGGQSVAYGIICGGERITFIKSGRGGTYRGYDDKYVKMARRIHDCTQNTVICADNPVDCVTYDTDKAVIEEYAAQYGFTCFEISLIGSSNGGYQNLFLAGQLPQTRKILFINMPLMVNYHKITKALQTMDHIEKAFVYGTLDPSFRYLPMLEMKKYPLCYIIRVDGADHTFTDRTEDFIALADFIM